MSLASYLTEHRQRRQDEPVEWLHIPSASTDSALAGEVEGTAPLRATA